MVKKDRLEDDNEELLERQRKAVDMLYDAMLFWHDEGSKLIKQLKDKLNVEGEGRIAANIAKIWKDVDDRWIDIAAKLAPYQSAKLSNIQVTKNEIKRFVIEVPSIIEDKREWLSKVEKEQKLLPKPTIINNIPNGHDNDIDEIEYDELNG
jgi:hypothetical protein